MVFRSMLLAASALMVASCSKTPQPIRVTGSATVYPFTKAVADTFVQAQSGRAQPIIDSTGTGPGIRSFCAGGGSESPDIVDASRRMKRAEFDQCQAHGAGEIVEIRIGLDGVALAQSAQAPKLALSRKDIYLALAATPMDKPNAAKTWRDVNPSLAATPIKVLGPSPTSGTRDQFVSLLLEPGCLAAVPAAASQQTKGDPAVFDRTCHALRNDGAFVAEGENYGETAQNLERDVQAVGVFGYSYLEQNASRLRGVPIDGVAPEYAAIASGNYPGARTLFLYVKKQHLKKKPELQAFLNQYAGMWNPDGPLTKRGLIAMSQDARDRAAGSIKDGEALDRESLF